MNPKVALLKTVMGILLLGVLWSPPSLAAEDPDALYEQGRFAEAEKAYAEADMDHPKDVRYRFNRGCAAFQNGDFQGATAAFSSVLRRAEDDETRFKAVYNLANAAFKQGDFQHAADLYRQAILSSPESKDAKYNLELALRELERLQQQEDQEQDTQPQGEPGQGEDQQDQAGQKSEDQDKSSQQEASQEQPSQESSQGEDQPTDKDQEEAEEEAASDETKGAEQNQGKQAGEESPQDLSGQLKAMDALPQDREDDEAPGAAMSMVDKRKAEALLDNVEEDRAKFLQFQVPKDKRHGVLSGRDW
ncbi:MAG: tetratricopeptide repeat protein [Thermodesulfobacteriota bacterium]|nr:tetratricopeptide repeat protein [Thermodesulfobacteriota bacterium]